MRNLFDNPFLLVILVLIIVVVFGASRLPGAARSLGRSLRIFKSEVRQMNDDEPTASKPDAPIEGRIVNDDESRRRDHGTHRAGDT